ncbi:MAG: DegT/DnrJ/EryC1/StrS family aminotransferase [Planctomycetes bacterium]|nr:DegT/DnrJ/EryC1/StrS family aminotransferase [Planctomycetota bacterium]
MKVSFLNLREVHEQLRPGLESAALRVISSGRFVLGPEVEKFEKDFAAYCGAAHAIAVNSGTSALHLALLAAGVKAGDEVITVPLTFVATASAIQYTGARVVLVDVDPEYYTMDPEQLRSAITARTRAILPVHLYGQPADMDPINDIARRHGIPVIEDACQAHGASYKRRRTGTLGQLSCFSFYPSKNLGACGEGGAVVTSDPEFDRKIRMLRDWGQESKYRHVLKGFNYRMEELQAAILNVKLPHLEAWNDARRQCAEFYAAELRDSTARVPLERPGTRHVWHVYPARVRDRSAVRSRLHEAGVETGIHYPDPIHLMPAFADLGHGPGSFPISEAIAREELSLPMFPGLGRPEVEYVGRLLRD